MGNEKHVLEDVSAYLDGEVDDPARVEAHLRACPDCAAHYQELRALTVQVRRLRAPEVRPEFVTRVLAQVREESRATVAVPWWTWLWGQRFVPAMSGAFAGVVVGLAAYYSLARAPEAPSTQVALAPVVPVAEAPGVVQELAQAGVDVAAFAEVYAEEGTAEGASETDAEDTAPIIETEFLAMLDAGWAGEGDDAFAALDDLSVSEQEALGVLLQGGAYPEATNEG